jgi:hypothetical protein
MKHKIEIVRSWPPEKWMFEQHPYIEDNSTRITIASTRDYMDYRPLIEVNDDFIHMDWDIAIGRDELRAFAEKCYAEPNKIRAGPYRSYPTRRYRLGWDKTKETTWHAWHSLSPKVEVKPGDPTCKWFGMGFVYVPFWIWQEFVNDCNRTGRQFCSARALAAWYHSQVEETIALDWETNLVHVNYSIKDALDLDY